MLSNKRIHELLKKLKVHKDCFNGAIDNNDLHAQAFLPAIFMQDILEILEHLLEVDIQEHGDRKFCDKHQKDWSNIFEDNNGDPYWCYWCEDCHKEKSQQDKENT